MSQSYLIKVFKKLLDERSDIDFSLVDGDDTGRHRFIDAIDVLNEELLDDILDGCTIDEYLTESGSRWLYSADNDYIENGNSEYLDNAIFDNILIILEISSFNRLVKDDIRNSLISIYETTVDKLLILAKYYLSQVEYWIIASKRISGIVRNDTPIEISEIKEEELKLDIIQYYSYKSKKILNLNYK